MMRSPFVESSLFGPGRSTGSRGAALVRTAEPTADFLAMGADYWDNPDYGAGYGGYAYDGRYADAAQRMVQVFDLRQGDRVLEIGAAKGFVLVEFYKLGMRVTGLEKSDYARAHAHPDIAHRIHPLLAGDKWPSFWKPFDLVVCKEVLPHIDENELPKKLAYLRNCARHCYVLIQTAENEEAATKMRAWDVTHRTIRPAAWWRELLSKHRFQGTVEFKPLFE